MDKFFGENRQHGFRKILYRMNGLGRVDDGLAFAVKGIKNAHVAPSLSIGRLTLA